MSIPIFTIIILFVYLFALKFVGYYAYKKSTHSTEDYFLSNRNVGTFALIATTAASIFSTGTVVASPSEFYSKGTGYFWIFAFTLCASFMGLLVLKFWKLGKAKGFVTPGDLFKDFYKSTPTKVISGIIGITALVPYAAAQMVAIGKTFEALTDGVISYNIAVTIVFFAIGLYLYYGGSRAVILTDVVQGVLFSALLLISGIMCLKWAGGWDSLVTNLLDKAPNNVKFTPSMKYYDNILICASFFLLPHVWQRMYMAKSAKTIAKNVAVIPIIFVFLFSITWVIGNSAFTYLPAEITDADNLLGAIFNLKAPYFGSFVLVAAFAAGMSTVDSQLLSAGSLVTKDLLPHKELDSETEFKIARFTTIALLLGIFLWSLTLQNASVFGLIILGVSLTPMLIPATFGIFFWKKSSSKGAFWSMALGLSIFIIKQFTTLGDMLPFMGAVLWSFITATLSFIIISLLTKHEDLDEKRKEYSDILSINKAVSFEGQSLPPLSDEDKKIAE